MSYTPVLWRPGFGTRLLLPYSTEYIKFLLGWRPIISAKVSEAFVVEATAALSILAYLAFLSLVNRWEQKSSPTGIIYSVLTGICVGAGTIVFFLLFQKGGPLSSVPAILAGGAAIMALAGIRFFTNRHPGSESSALGLRLSVCFCCANKNRSRNVIRETSASKSSQAVLNHSI